MAYKTGALNLITDIAGLRVGNAQDTRLKSGSTVLVGDAPFTASVHVMGGAPGTRETDLLAPDKRCNRLTRWSCRADRPLGLMPAAVLRTGCAIWDADFAWDL